MSFDKLPSTSSRCLLADPKSPTHVTRFPEILVCECCCIYGDEQLGMTTSPVKSEAFHAEAEAVAT